MNQPTHLQPKYGPGMKFMSQLVNQKPVYAMKTRKKKRTMGVTMPGHESRRKVEWL